MPKNYLFKNIRILYDSKRSVQEEDVLIVNGNIKAFGKQAEKEGKDLGIKPESGKDKLLAPCLVDPHSFLESPFNRKFENITSLIKRAASSGYGQVALMPRSPEWRDRIELLKGIKSSENQVIIHLWGGFSLKGEGENLSRHKDLLQNGAIGLAEDDFMPSITLLSQGFLLGEMDISPVLIAPRDKKLQGEGMTRESVETLRAGWNPDPIGSEISPLSQLLELHKQHPEIALRLMNISTTAGVDLLRSSSNNIFSSVSWWHLLQDTSNLYPHEIGWSVTPSLGSPQDRESLKKGAKEGVIGAIAVNSIPLDDAGTKQPPAVREKGISSFQLVLPSLWEELIVKSGWKIETLWERLSFGPSKLLKLPEEQLTLGSNRWILFDPHERWFKNFQPSDKPLIANEPYLGKEICGKVLDSGLTK